MLNEEHKISKAFLKRPWKKLTFNEIKELSGKKSKSYVYSGLNRLLNEDILLSERVGKSVLYSLNLSSYKTQSHLGLLHEYISWRAGHVPFKVIEKIASRIGRITSFFVLIITGSYAKQKQTKHSDLDLFILCEDSINPKSLLAEIRLESELSMPKVHPFVFTKKEFLQMLADEEENYGKEAARYNMVFFGGQSYYNILNEAVKRGFRG